MFAVSLVCISVISNLLFNYARLIEIGLILRIIQSFRQTLLYFFQSAFFIFMITNYTNGKANNKEKNSNNKCVVQMTSDQKVISDNGCNCNGNQIPNTNICRKFLSR